MTFKPYCLNCKHYTPEYQGWADYVNFCLIKKRCVHMESEGCPLWEPASDEVMEMRFRTWQQWKRVRQ